MRNKSLRIVSTPIFLWRTESKIELKIDQGQVVDYIVKGVQGKRPLPNKQLTDFKELTEKLADENERSWIDYFILHKKVDAKKIMGSYEQRIILSKSLSRIA